jgi:hypothetical protein
MARYVTQRDPDGRWSVRESDTHMPAEDRGVPLVGLNEKLACLHARRLNNWNIGAESRAVPSPWQNRWKFKSTSAA